MPFRDGSGPAGSGPMTGRGLGNCTPTGSDAARPRFFGRGLGRGPGRGYGRGFGRGFCNWFGGGRANQPASQDNLNNLRHTAQNLRESLNDIEERINSLEKDK